MMYFTHIDIDKHLRSDVKSIIELLTGNSKHRHKTQANVDFRGCRIFNVLLIGMHKFNPAKEILSLSKCSIDSQKF